MAAIGLVALTGCQHDDIPQPAAFTRMPVTLDYRAHRVLHPPTQQPSGSVVPEDPAVGRDRNFGPDARATIPNLVPKLVATLDTFRRSAPVAGAAMLALAKARRTKAPPAVAADFYSAEDGVPPSAREPREIRDDAPGVEDRRGGYTLNFEDAEIKDVMQAVLGKVLGLNYTIAPNVTGRITISSSAPQNRAELLSTIETVLSLQGLSLTKSGSTYRIAPLSVGGGSLDKNGSEAGFGISVVPVEYTSVSSIMKLLSGFVVDADGVRIDSSRNAVIVRGPAPRRDEIVRAIKAFDGDWMHQQTVSVFELRRSHPDEVIGELNRIFDIDTKEEGAGVVQFKAIKRLRAIMVISKNATLVKRAGSWIRRLDHQDASATDSIFVYRPRNRDARELARLVNGLFGNGSQGGQGQSDNGSVAFQQANGSPSQGAFGQSTSGTSTGSSGGIGASSASYAGGLSSGGLGASSGGSSGSLGAGSSGIGGGASFGGGAGSSQGSSSGLGGSNGSGSGSGSQGSLAEPIEASSQGNNNNNRAHLSLTADPSNNSVVAYTDGETYTKVQSILRQLDVPPLQVAINVIIAEVALNDELKYGIQFFLNTKQLGFAQDRGSIGLADTAAAVIASKLPGFNFIAGGASSPDLVISALDQISKVHVLSSPSIVVAENKPATFEVGNQVPIITQQATSNLTVDAPTVNSVQYLDTGIILKIIPRVGQNGSVAMDLDQLISDVVNDGSGGANLTPTISKRRVASAISVRSGQTVLLAGLIKDSRSQTHGQLPFVGSQLGDIFGNKDNTFARTELVVFIRPVIIRDGQDAQSVAEEYKSHLGAMNIQAPPVYKP